MVAIPNDDYGYDGDDDDGGGGGDDDALDDCVVDVLLRCSDSPIYRKNYTNFHLRYYFPHLLINYN